MNKLRLLADMTRHSTYALRAMRCGWNELAADSATACAARDAKRFLDACDRDVVDFVVESRRAGIGAVKWARRGDDQEARTLARISVRLINEAVR
jgi:hypothetical protein